MMTIRLVLLTLLLHTGVAAESSKLPAGLNEFAGAIFQRDQVINLKTKTRGMNNQKVQATLAGVSADGSVVDNTIHVSLPPVSEPGGPHVLSLTIGDKTYAIPDIYIGDIWLCVGQSNMVFGMDNMHSPKTSEPAKQDRYPLIRFKQGKTWQPMDSFGIIKRTAGTPYYFARKLHTTLKIPIGIRTIGAGGTSLWLWTPKRLHETPQLAPLKQQMLKRVTTFKELLKNNPKLRGKDVKPLPAPGFAPHGYWLTGVARGKKDFGGMDYSDWLPKQACKGIVFWQGEADGGLCSNYEHLFGAMIELWKSKATHDWPFIFIQLPSYHAGPKDTAYGKRPGFIGIRDAQRRVANRFDNVQMMVGLDIYGIKSDIHPSNKIGYGTRLAQTALGMVYGHALPWRSPEFDSWEANGQSATVTFRHVGSGLKSRLGNKSIREFQLAGPDRIFHPADARITAKNTITVTSKQVNKPTAVRYGWKESPHVDLLGDGDLPASPFRSDDWELWPVSADKNGAQDPPKQ